MGFSVSGATVVILIGMLVAFAMVFPAAMTSIDQLADAYGQQQSDLETWHNADIELVEAIYDTDSETLMVNASNEGTEPLAVRGIHLLVDGELPGDVTRSVDADPDASTWLPGETLELTVEDIDHPERIKLVTGIGLTAVTEDVTEATDG